LVSNTTEASAGWGPTTAGTSLFDDAGLLEGDLGQRFAQMLHVVERDGHQHARQRSAMTLVESSRRPTRSPAAIYLPASGANSRKAAQVVISKEGDGFGAVDAFAFLQQGKQGRLSISLPARRMRS